MKNIILKIRKYHLIILLLIVIASVTSYFLFGKNEVFLLVAFAFMIIFEFFVNR